MNKIEYPEEIDGAKTLLIGKIENGNFGFTPGFDGNVSKIQYLSINQYKNNDRYYLFLLNEQYETLSDYLEDSIDDAKNTASRIFLNVHIKWLILK